MSYLINPYMVAPAGLTLQYEQNSYPTTTHTMRHIWGNAGTSSFRFAGSHVGSSLNGTEIKQVVQWFKQVGDCSGLTLYAQVRNISTGCTIKKELGSVDASAISASNEAVTFPEQAAAYTLVTGDVIGYYLDGGSGSNNIAMVGSCCGGKGDSYTNYGESNFAACAWETATDVQQPAVQVWA